MRKITEFWFEFNGIRDTTKGVMLADVPNRFHPATRGQQLTTPGRHGYIWVPEDAYAQDTIKVKCFTSDSANMDDINAWLSGAGLLRFSDEPTRAYEARVIKRFERTNRLSRFTMQEFTVVFECQPFRLYHPAATDISITASNTKLTNPGTAPSAPRLTIAGGGSFSVTIGMQTQFFEGVTGGGIIVDTELMDAFTFDGSTLANSRVSGEFMAIPPGDSYITWIVESGSVSKVTIRPRWRYL